MRETLIGFDSAWSDNAPGGICFLSIENGRIVKFMEPMLVRFDQAIEVVKSVTASSDYVLIALDQPTLVPNVAGIRPVERVAGSVVNGLGGGVQPANRSKEAMFGPNAPIWTFLDALGARENPDASRHASHGLFLMEVFPALALPSLIPEIWTRRCAAKYNPATKKFLISDWELVTSGIAELARNEGLDLIADALAHLNMLQKPKKGDQDKVDAIICLLIAYIWRFGAPERSLVIGDECSGYIVSPASAAVRERLRSSAERLQVPFDQSFSQDAVRSLQSDVETLEVRADLRVPKGTADGGRNAKLGQRQCPECQHLFMGKGWGGIDAHWKSQHHDVMPYEEAWPLIRKGLKPSDSLKGSVANFSSFS